MINQLKNLSNNKIIDIIKDNLGRIIYEAWKKLLASGIPPLTLLNCKQDNLVDYKIYGNSEQGILPKEYQQVEYIEGTGTQYLIIDYIASGITSSKGKYQITDTTKARFLFGSRGANGESFYGYNWGGGAPYKYYNSYKSGLATSVEIDDQVHTFYKNKGALYIDDTFIQARSDIDFTTPHNMNVFACYNDTQAGYLPAYAKLYYLQFYDNETLMIDLIPCYRKSDDEIGMYDLVNDIFYTNLGTGVFLKGSDTPTPNNPAEVESVGDKTKNLFDKNIPFINAYITTAHEDGSYRWNSSSDSKSWAIPCKPNTTYTFSHNDDGSAIFRVGYVTCAEEDFPSYSGVPVMIYNVIRGTTQKQLTITTGEDATYIVVQLGFSQSVITVETLQIEESSTATEYEPYGYKVPVKVSGKNLANLDKFVGGSIIEYNGVQCYKYLDGGSDNFAYIDEFKENTQYIFTIKIYSSDTTKNTAIKFTYTDGTSSSEVISKFNTKYSFITSSGKTLQSITGDWYWGIARYIDLTATQLEEGTTATNYEPYIEPITTNIYLNEPLRKIGDYADYIDFESKKVVRNIYHKIATGKEAISFSTRSISFINITPVSISGHSANNVTMCNYYKSSDWESLWQKGYGTSYTDTQGIAASTTTIRIVDMLNYPNANTDTTQATLFKEHLANLYANGTPLIIDYVLETPIEENIELPNIPTHKGTTIIEIDTSITPSNMEVVYLGK